MEGGWGAGGGLGGRKGVGGWGGWRGVGGMEGGWGVRVREIWGVGMGTEPEIRGEEKGQQGHRDRI